MHYALLRNYRVQMPVSRLYLVAYLFLVPSCYAIVLRKPSPEDFGNDPLEIHYELNVTVVNATDGNVVRQMVDVCSVHGASRGGVEYVEVSRVEVVTFCTPSCHIPSPPTQSRLTPGPLPTWTVSSPTLMQHSPAQTISSPHSTAWCLAQSQVTNTTMHDARPFTRPTCVLLLKPTAATSPWGYVDAAAGGGVCMMYMCMMYI